MSKKTNYKAGVYMLHKTPDIFQETKITYGDVIETRLNATEAKNLFSGKLYEKIGFCGWSWIKD